MTFRFSSFADDKSTVRHPKYEDFVKFNLLKKRIRQMSLGRNPGLVVMVGSNPGTVYWMDIYSHIKDRK